MDPLHQVEHERGLVFYPVQYDGDGEIVKKKNNDGEKKDDKARKR